MKQAQRKDFFREIRKSWNRWLSLLFIVALGVAFFSGVRSSEPDMRLSADRLEYTLGNAHLVQGASLGEIAALYDDLRLATGEDGHPELAFSQLEAAEAFTRRALANRCV